MSVDQRSAHQTEQLNRSITGRLLFFYVLGDVLGSGIYALVGIMAAHGIPYAATLSIAHPMDFRRKLLTAFNTKGMKFLLIHSPCPTGWKSEPSDGIELVLVLGTGLTVLALQGPGRVALRPEPPHAAEARCRRLNQ